MKLAVMQPYLFPYIGYFQLMNAVDHFVYHDDVQFIKGGWINRNNFLENMRSKMFSFPVRKDHHEKNINDRYFCDPEKTKIKFMSFIKSNYCNAPYYEEVFPIVIKIFNEEILNVSNMIIYAHKIINDYLGITTASSVSSEIKKNNALKGENRVIEICKRVGCDVYINPIGGSELYDKNHFKEAGIKLCFLKSEPVIYSQYENEFIPNLSIVDVMMFNPLETIRKYLNNYSLT